MQQREEFARIKSFGALERGWDSYDADPIAPETVEYALHLAALFHDFPGPLNPCPAADGTICFEICWPDGRELWIDVGPGEAMKTYIPKESRLTPGQ